MPVGTGHVYGHVMASHTQTNLARQTKETRRVNVSKCIDWVNKGQVMVRETVVETLLFVGWATTAWKLSTVPEQIGSLVACLVIVEAVLKLICRCASYQTCGCLRGNRRGGLEGERGGVLEEDHCVRYRATHTDKPEVIID